MPGRRQRRAFPASGLGGQPCFDGMTIIACTNSFYIKICSGNDFGINGLSDAAAHVT